MNHDLQGRLYNWKFAQAQAYLEGEPLAVAQLVQALAQLVGDCGWGLDGALGVVINAALTSLAEKPTS